MLTIIVSKRTEKIGGIDFHARVNKVYVRLGKQFMRLESHKLKHPQRVPVRLVLRTRFGYARLPQNKQLQEALATFLRDYHAKIDMEIDCYFFACLAVGLPVHSREYLLWFWEFSKVKKLKIGEVIFFIDTKQQYFNHAAISLGNGLFISVYGAGGDLEVSSLNDMKKLFKSKEVVIATPIHKAVDP